MHRLLYPGDTIPKIFIFFGDLQYYSILLLVESLIIKSLLESTEKPSVWMTNLTTYAKSNSFMSVLAGDNTKKLPEDSEELIDNVEQEKSTNAVRKTFCRFVDRTLTVVTVVVFAFMFMSLFPRGYLTANYDPVESLS
jgi:hypothetical protein